MGMTFIRNICLPFFFFKPSKSAVANNHYTSHQTPKMNKVSTFGCNPKPNMGKTCHTFHSFLDTKLPA